MPAYIEDLHPTTAPISKLPLQIYYFRSVLSDYKIMGFHVSIKNKDNSSYISKYFSIGKYSLETAYREAVKHAYGSDASKVLEEYPTPYIHPSDLFDTVKSGGHRTTVCGVVKSFSTGYTNYLTGFTVNLTADGVFYFSIPKLGLEGAWQKAVECRYAHREPVVTDKPELPLEYWDMINPKYKVKTR